MSETSPPRTLVVLATYNERDNLEPLVCEILKHLPDADVLVVDDASPDGTGDIADRLAEQNRRINVLHRAGKLGLGTATLDAMRLAISRDYDFVVIMDADFSHPPRNLPDLTAGMEHCDVMIGSRYVAGGNVVGWTRKRKLMSWAINVYSRLLLGLKARDCSGAFRCYRVGKLRELDFSRVYSKGYSFQEEILYHCQRAGCRIGETPIVFEDRRYGQSKINLKEAVTALWALLYTAVRR
jgi:dolichol-phosphate mannosyltransferase